MWSKIKTAIRHRSTEKSKVPLQAFVESGTSQDFKRCVLEHIGYCRIPSVAFWGTYSYAPGVGYEQPTVVLDGTNMWVQIEGVTYANETQNVQTLASTGTIAGSWLQEGIQGGGHEAVDPACAPNLDDYCDAEVRAQDREEAVYSSP